MADRYSSVRLELPVRCPHLFHAGFAVTGVGSTTAEAEFCVFWELSFAAIAGSVFFGSCFSLLFVVRVPVTSEILQALAVMAMEAKMNNKIDFFIVFFLDFLFFITANLFLLYLDFSFFPLREPDQNPGNLHHDHFQKHTA